MMKTKITYSFIIPHHNTPKLLERLINSIPQREDIEIIVVDDNSDEDLKAQPTRSDVKIINIGKEHSKGAGRARNVGMNVASGKWLLFADADDFYDSDFISILDEYKHREIDVLYFGVASYNDGTSPARKGTVGTKIMDNYDGTEETANNVRYFIYGPWNKMISRDFVNKKGIRFEESVKGNDQMFSLLTSYFAEKWEIDKRILYWLTYTPGSLTVGKLSKEKCIADLKLWKKRANFYKEIGHAEWNWNCCRGHLHQSCIYQIYKKLRKNKKRGMQYLYYYVTCWLSIRKSANYFVEVAGLRISK